MKKQLLIFYHKSKLDKLDIRKRKHFIIIWEQLIIGYIIVREILGLHPILINIYLILLLLCRLSFRQVSLSFFVIGLFLYISGQTVEANNCMSYVFVFLVLSIIKEYWITFINKK